MHPFQQSNRYGLIIWKILIGLKIAAIEKRNSRREENLQDSPNSSSELLLRSIHSPVI
jgi:hypothetical protein